MTTNENARPHRTPTPEIDGLIGRSRFLAAGQDDPHSSTITELCDALEKLNRHIHLKEIPMTKLDLSTPLAWQMRRLTNGVWSNWAEIAEDTADHFRSLTRTDIEVRSLVGPDNIAKLLAHISALEERNVEMQDRLDLELDAYAKDHDMAALRARAEKAEERLKKQVTRATNAEYMGWAYRNMLGEKGREVAAMWDAKGVKRVHFDWGPEAGNLTGEQRAEQILAWENAPRREILPGELDEDFPTSQFLKDISNDEA